MVSCCSPKLRNVPFYALCCHHCVSHAPLTCSCLTADGVSSVHHVGGPAPLLGDGPAHLHRESIGENPHVTATMSEISTAGGVAMTTMTAAGGTESGAGAHLHKGSRIKRWSLVEQCLCVVCWLSIFSSMSHYLSDRQPSQ